MASFKLYKERVLGSGTYGNVYRCKMEIDNENQNVAFKRNYGDPDMSGIYSLRELNFLKSIEHVSVIKLIAFSGHETFDEDSALSPKEKHSNLVEDKVHFVMELMEMALDTFLAKKRVCGYGEMKTIMGNIVEAVEYLHRKKIMHCDIKAENILVSETNTNNLHAKLCDFGLSIYPNFYIDPPEGNVTAQYRAPEIVGGARYAYPADVWSVGCLFFYIITRCKHLFPLKEEAKDITNLNCILKNSPHPYQKSILEWMAKRGYKVKVRTFQKANNRGMGLKDIIIHMSRDDKIIDNFNACSGGNFDDFLDITEKMLYIEDNLRPTSEEILEHRFFKNIVGKKAEIKEEIDEVEIIDCLERRIAANIIINIYNYDKQKEWYGVDILFHTIRIVDKYLSWAFKNNKLREYPVEDIGVLHTKLEMELIVYTCYYMMYKFFFVLGEMHPVRVVFPQHLRSQKYYKEFEKIEELIALKICDGKIYERCFLDYMSDYSLENKSQRNKYEDITTALGKYVKLKEKGETNYFYKSIFKGSSRELFEYLMLSYLR